MQTLYTGSRNILMRSDEGFILQDAPDKVTTLVGKLYHIAPLREPGVGRPRTDYRWNTTIHRGLDKSRALDDPGHGARKLYYGTYTNWVFDGLVIAEPLADPGHNKRYNLSYGGPFNPHQNNGVTAKPLQDPGHLAPTDGNGLYGFNKVNEWRGLPSAQAL